MNEFLPDKKALQRMLTKVKIWESANKFQPLQAVVQLHGKRDSWGRLENRPDRLVAQETDNRPLSCRFAG